MNLAYHKFNISLQLKEGCTNVIVLENARVMTEFLQDLLNQTENDEGEFLLTENNKELKFGKNVSLILNPLAVDCNEKKILSKLYAEMADEARNEFYEKTAQINTYIVNYLEELLVKMPYPIVYNEELDINAFLKSMGVGIDIRAESLLEKLLNYMKIMAMLNNIKVMIFLNIKSFLNHSELMELYKEAENNKIHLILIENVQRDKIINEKILIVDNDLCIINV